MVNQVTEVKTEVDARKWLFSSKLDFEKSSEKLLTFLEAYRELLRSSDDWRMVLYKFRYSTKFAVLVNLSTGENLKLPYDSDKMALIISPETEYPFNFEKVMSIEGNFQVKGTPLIITGKNDIYKDERTYFISKSKSESELESD